MVASEPTISFIQDWSEQVCVVNNHHLPHACQRLINTCQQSWLQQWMDVSSRYGDAPSRWRQFAGGVPVNMRPLHPIFTPYAISGKYGDSHLRKALFGGGYFWRILIDCNCGAEVHFCVWEVNCISHFARPTLPRFQELLWMFLVYRQSICVFKFRV